MRSRIIGCLAALALVAVACGSDDDEGGAASTPAATDAAAGDTAVDSTAGSAPASSAPDGTTAETSGGTAGPATTEASDETTARAVESDPDGTFTYSTFYEPSRFDPHLAANAGDATALFLTYDRLIHLSPDAETIPGLAESWEYSDDGLTLTLHLREGVTFHDGTPFDADAVTANLERAKTLEGSVVANDLANVTSIEVVDPMTVTLTLAAPQASLLAILSDRHGAMICPSAFDDPDLPTTPCGTGMYKLTQYLPGDRISFERNEDYWDPDAVGAAKFEFVLIPDTQARLNALRTGVVDAASLEPAQIADAEADGLQVNTRTTMVYQQMYMNRAREPFTDINVRKALNHAVDRQAIVDALDFGYGEPNSQIFPAGFWAFDEEIGSDFYTYDPDKARQLLADSAYPDGFSFDMLLPTPGTPPALAEILQAEFADIGVTMTVTQTPAQGVADLFFKQQEGVAMLGVWSGRQDPSMTTSLRWTSTGFANPGGHSTPEIEALNQAALTTLDPDEREEAMHELVAAGTEEALDLVIYNPVSVSVGTSRVATMPTVIANGKVEFRGASVTPD